MKRWIWEQSGYPNFTYDIKKLTPLLEKVSLAQGYLVAMAKVMSQDNIAKGQFDALMNEAISTSAIEGEILNRESVKASINKKLGIKDIKTDTLDKQTDYLVEILIDANTNYDKDLNNERLFGWHNALFPKGYSGLSKIKVAEFRGEESMEIVSGAFGKEKT